MKRIFAISATIVLCMSMILTFGGCGKKKREIVKLTLSTEDSEAILAAAGIMLPDAETTSAAGTTVDFYAWGDPFHNYSDDEIINTGYWTFSQKYGCDVNWIECEYGERFDGLANLILAGTSPDFYGAYPENFPEKPIKRMFQPVDTYIDYDDALWSGMKDFAYNYFSLGGRTYVMVTDNYAGPVCAYNRRVVEEWGFDDPAELYANDEWTWDIFYEMCVDFSDPDENRYALDGFSYSSGLMHSSGIGVVEYDPAQNKYISNIDEPGLERAATLLYNLSKNQCMFPTWKNGYSIRNGVEGGGIKEGDCLFYIRHDYCFTGPVADISNVWGDISAGEVMFCPTPRDPQGDGKYYIESMPGGYFLVKGAENPEGVALLAACERFKVLDPTVISIDKRQKEEIYLWTQEMLDMWDTCHALANNSEHTLIYYEYGLGKQLADVVSTIEGNGHSNDAKTWAQLKESNSEKLAYYVDELNKQISEFDPDAA